MEKLKDKINKLGWSVYEINFADGTGWEIGKYSPAGEDFTFCIQHNNNKKQAIKEIKESAEYFDEDEHARIWANAGNVGQPQTLKELVEDAESIHLMLLELANNL